MSADTTQAILTKLYTDSSFRKEFVADKELFYKKHCIISQEIIDYINAIPVEQIEFFAKGLYSKRMHEVMALIPLSKRIMGSLFHQYFPIYTEKYNPTGIHKHHDDTLHFIDYLRNTMLRDPAQTDEYLLSVLSYEEKRIRNFISREKHSISIFKYDHLKHYQPLLKMNEMKFPEKKLIIVYWKNGKGKKII